MTGMTGTLTTADGWLSSYGIVENIVANNPLIFTQVGPLHDIGLHQYNLVTGFNITSSTINTLIGITGYDAFEIIVTGTYNIDFSVELLRLTPLKYPYFYLTYGATEITGSFIRNGNSKSINYTADSTGLLSLRCTEDIDAAFKEFNYTSDTTLKKVSGNNYITSSSLNSGGGSGIILVVAYNINVTGTVGSSNISFTDINNLYRFYASTGSFSSINIENIKITGTWASSGDVTFLSVFSFMNFGAFNISFSNYEDGQIIGNSNNQGIISYAPLNINDTVFLFAVADKNFIINSPNTKIIFNQQDNFGNFTQIHSIHALNFNQITISFFSTTVLYYLLIEGSTYQEPNYIINLNVMRINT